MTTALYSLSINARATLDLHSLNNEGGEGNQIQTRMVNVIDQNGELQSVNAISGDMFKHIQAEHLFNIARTNNLSLCAGCKEFNANRINADEEFFTQTNGQSDVDTTNALLHSCTIDDIEGILITEGKRSLPRKSVIEFGWVVGVPGKVTTDSYFHVKYSSADRSKTAESRQDEAERGSNLGQAIFHRPTSSGIYAIVCHLELARIGFNDISQQYTLDEAERLTRMRALLESTLYTFLQPNGAMRSAQAPHLVNFEGVVSISTQPTPAPTCSPLKDDYREQVTAIAERLGSIRENSIQVFSFDNMAEFTEIVGALMQDTYAPFALQY